MATSKEFQEKFKSGNFLEAFQLALSEVIHLNITTTVVTAESPTASKDEGRHRMRTLINLIDGDIETEINSLFLNDGPYTDLRQFHMNQVREGRQIIRDNVASLQDLLKVCLQMTGQADSLDSSHGLGTADPDLWSTPTSESVAAPSIPEPPPPPASSGLGVRQPLTTFEAKVDSSASSFEPEGLGEPSFGEAAFGGLDLGSAALDRGPALDETFSAASFAAADTGMMDSLDLSDAIAEDNSSGASDGGLGEFGELGFGDEPLDLDAAAIDPADLPPELPLETLGDLDLGLDAGLGNDLAVDLPTDLGTELDDRDLALGLTDALEEGLSALDSGVESLKQGLPEVTASLENPFPDDDPISELIRAAQEAVPSGPIPHALDSFQEEAVEFEAEFSELIVNPVKKLVSNLQDQDAETVPDVGNPLTYIQAQLAKQEAAIAAANPVDPQQLQESLGWVSQALDTVVEARRTEEPEPVAAARDPFFEQAEPWQIVDRALDQVFAWGSASVDFDNDDVNEGDDDDLLDFSDTDFSEAEEEEGSGGADQDLSLEADLSAALGKAEAAIDNALALDDNPLGSFEIPEDLDPLADLELPGLDMPSLATDTATVEAPPPPPPGQAPRAEAEEGLEDLLGEDLLGEDLLGEDLEFLGDADLDPDPEADLGDALVDLGGALDEGLEEVPGSIAEAMDHWEDALPEGAMSQATAPIVPPAEAMTEDILEDLDFTPPTLDITLDVTTAAVDALEEDVALDLEGLDLSDRLMDDAELDGSLLEDSLEEEAALPPVPPPAPPLVTSAPPAIAPPPEDLGLESVEDFDTEAWDEAPAGTPLEESLGDDRGLDARDAALDLGITESEDDLNLEVIDELDELDNLDDLEDLGLEELDEEEDNGPGLGPDTTDPLANLFGNTAPEDFGELDALASEQDLLLEELGTTPAENHPPVDLDDLALLDEDDPFASLELDDGADEAPPPPPPRRHP